MESQALHNFLKGPNMKRLILALALAAVAVSGCAHLEQASGGAGAPEEQSPYPKTHSNDHYYPL
jgi:hypothetical protein